MTHFAQTHHAQNPVNIELLNFVNQRGTAAWRDLFNAFGEGPVDSKASRHRFGKKLEYLVYTGRLQASGKGRTRTFSIGPGANQAVPARGRTNSPSGQCSGVSVLVDVMQPQMLHFAGRLAPPHQYDVMNAPVYTHVLPAPTRPGALDFKRYDTHGVRC